MTLVNEQKIMQQCLQLAQHGAGKVNPNPMVGCVIVQNGEIVGRGYHKKFGGPHAEVVALNQAGKKAHGAILFVNLEPCAHFGKTPPCTDAIIKAGISRVVIASKDPNPLVSGKGIRQLRNAGIHVTVGILRNKADMLNEKFFKFMKTGVPFVGIKLAQTIDGRIADVSGKSKWITSKAARTEVHRLRSHFDAVLVGAHTVLYDNPTLTVRFVKARNPVRVVVDGRLSLSTSRTIFQTSVAQTWVLTSVSAVKRNIRKVQKLVSQGVRVLPVTSDVNIDANTILRVLATEGISSILLEGGAGTINAFITGFHADTLFLFIAPKILGGGLNGFVLNPPKLLHNSIGITIKKVILVGKDILLEATYNHT